MEKVSNFNNAIELIFKHEGGYVNHPSDPGGETKYGISKRSYPNEDISNLNQARAAQLYRRDFWDRVCGDELPYPLALFCFDTAVNLGTSAASRHLQDVVGAKVDGKIGPKTIEQAWIAFRRNPKQTLEELANHRRVYYSRLTTFSTFGKGWMKRVDETLKEAERWIETS